MLSGTRAEALKITMQYRARQRMVYELASGDASLAVHVWHEAADGVPEGWRVEAHESRAVDAIVITQNGSTRREALLAVGKAWDCSEHRLPRFDWEAVAVLLASVRAL